MSHDRGRGYAYPGSSEYAAPSLPSEYHPQPYRADFEDTHVHNGDHRKPSRGRTELFQANPTSPTAAIANGTSVLQGMKSVATQEDPFVPRTVYVGASGNPLDTAVTAGFITFLFQGTHVGGYWVRRFCCAPGEQVRIQVEAFSDVQVHVVHSTALGVSANVIVTEEITSGHAPEEAFLAVAYAGAGTFVVPYGAISFFPDVSDAGFSWVAGGPGANLTLVDATTLLTEKTVKGPTFVITKATSLLWKVGLF